MVNVHDCKKKCIDSTNITGNKWRTCIYHVYWTLYLIMVNTTKFTIYRNWRLRNMKLVWRRVDFNKKYHEIFSCTIHHWESIQSATSISKLKGCHSSHLDKDITLVSKQSGSSIINWPHVGLTLGQGRRLWVNVKPTWCAPLLCTVHIYEMFAVRSCPPLMFTTGI